MRHRSQHTLTSGGDRRGRIVCTLGGGQTRHREVTIRATRLRDASGACPAALLPALSIEMGKHLDLFLGLRLAFSQ